MKSTTLLPIFLLLLSTFIVSHLPSATATDTPVLDTEGDEIRNGGSYYILSALTGIGGVDLAATGNETCPLTIVQATREGDEGKPVIISSRNPSPVIYESSPTLYLEFAPVPACAPTPSEWTVVEGLPGKPSALKITGYNGTVKGFFAIEKSSFGPYKLTFCRLLGRSNSCSDVGARVENGQRSLALSGGNLESILLRFKKHTLDSGRIEKA